DVHQASEAGDGFVLKRREVAGTVFENGGAELAKVLCVDEVDSELNFFAVAANAAFDDEIFAEVAARRGRGKDLSAADNACWHNPERLLRGVEIRKFAGERIHEAFGDGFVGGIVAYVVEGKNSDVALGGLAGDQGGGALTDRREKQSKCGKNHK